MPVTAIVGRIIGDHDQVADTDRDLLLTSGTQVRLARLIWLHAGDRDVTVRGSLHGVRLYETVQSAACIRQPQSMPTSPGEVIESCVSPTNV